MFYTYLFRNPVTMVAFYVGKGKGRRFKQHMGKKGGGNKQVSGYIRQLKEEGFDPQITVSHFDTEYKAFEMEKILISIFGRKDIGTGTLLNHTDGGEGNALFGEINGRYGDHRTWEDLVGKEQAAKWKEKRRIESSGKNNPMWGKKRPDLSERNRMRAKK